MLLWRGEALNASRLLEPAVSTRPGHVPSYNNLAKAYFLVGLPDLAAATYEEALRRDPSNEVALTNLVRLTEAGGTPDGAAAYRRRLEELRRDPAAGSAPDASGPAEPDRSPPADSAKAATEPPVATPPPAMPIAVGDDPEAEALRELLHDLPNVRVERRGGRLTLVGWTNGTKER